MENLKQKNSESQTMAVDDTLPAQETASGPGEPSLFWMDLAVKISRRSKLVQKSAWRMRIEQAMQRLPITKDLMLIISPSSTWQVITENSRGCVFTFIIYLLPMLALLAFLDGLGLFLLGHRHLADGMTINRFTFPRAVIFEAIQGILFLTQIWIAAFCIKVFGNACHNRNRTSQSLLLVMHAAGPLLLIQCCNAIPGLNVWVTWLVGIALALGALYNGLPRILKPDVPSAMGLFFSAAVVFFLVMLLGRLLTFWHLTGDFKLMDRLVSALADNL